jgi:hypothetical protein
MHRRKKEVGDYEIFQSFTKIKVFILGVERTRDQIAKYFLF